MSSSPPLAIAAMVADKPLQRLAALLQQWDVELGKMIPSIPDGDASLRPYLVVLDVLETLSDSMPKAFKLLNKDAKLPFKKAIEALYLKGQQFIVEMSKQTRISEEEDEYDVSAPLPALLQVSIHHLHDRQFVTLVAETA